ncbi:hypothetical protein BJF78_20140 [Pseudonocardia sp. CNS-139]|nr:hypothetical protein BJF78_20140 [Pseudonocardia sp. CNS-139]
MLVDRRKVLVTLDRSGSSATRRGRAERVAAILRDYDDDQLATIAGFLGRLAEAELEPGGAAG